MANVVEVFSSIQGEGLYVGTRQVFLRLSGCNLQCKYCDTPHSRSFIAEAAIEQTPGRRDFILLPNPISLDKLSIYLNELLKSPHHSISFTGGEPLCQWQLIAELAPSLHGRIYLETNGTLYEELAQVLPHIDIISMDIKLPSSGLGTYWHEHRKFLKLASQCSVFVKIVLSGDTYFEEFDQAISLVKETGCFIPVVLQPVTPNEFCRGILPDMVLQFQERALNVLPDVRVIPQTHKFMGQL